MPHRVDLVSGAEGMIEVADVLGEFEYRLACRIEARRLVVRHLEPLRRVREELELILDRGDGGDVRGIGWIDQHPHGDKHPRRIELGNRQVVLARVMKDPVDVGDPG